MADAVLRASAVQATPGGYTVSQGQEIVLKSVRALVDGSGAASSFVPTLQLVDPSGQIVWEAPTLAPLAAAGSANVTWFPGVSEALLATNIVTIGVLAERPVGTPQSITSDFSFHTVTFADVQFDTNGMWSAGTPDRITCQVAGTYFVGAAASFVTNGTSDRGVQILKNGTTAISINEGPAGGAFFWAGFCAGSVSLVPGDFLQTQVGQHSGGNLNTGYCNISAFAVGSAPT